MFSNFGAWVLLAEFADTTDQERKD